jgi:hypothetical protein
MRESAPQLRKRKYNQDYKFELIQDLGMKYPIATSKRPQRYGLFKCHCGNNFEVISKHVNKYSSCGCLMGGVTHNLSKHILYDRYQGMMDRCYKESHKSYNNYGGRGIKVCDRWHSIANFIEDVYPSFSDGLTMDRIESDGDYEPSNFRWATRELQNQNTRIRVDGSSKYRGVYWNNQKQKYSCKIHYNGINKYIGTFTNELDAAIAYNNFVKNNELLHTLNDVV